VVYGGLYQSGTLELFELGGLGGLGGTERHGQLELPLRLAMQIFV